MAGMCGGGGGGGTAVEDESCVGWREGEREREREKEGRKEGEGKCNEGTFELKKERKERTLNGPAMDGLKRKRTKHKSKETRTLCLGWDGLGWVGFFVVRGHWTHTAKIKNRTIGTIA